MKKLCIYHGHCADGFGAAWVVRRALGDIDVEFVPGVYGEGVPVDVTGRDVIIVDFSYKREVMEAIASQAESVLVLDHHISAQKELQPLLDAGVIEGEFDLEKSGAMMAWQHFFGSESPPQLLRHIQDRDLWQFNLAGTRKIMAAVFSHPYEFKVWDRLMTTLVQTLFAEGIAIDRNNLKAINDHIQQNAYKAMIGGVVVPVVNCPGAWASDAGHIMGKGQPFAASYTETNGYRKYSLRSEPDGMDVSEIAGQYGGGGHKHAAGFRVPASRMR